MLGQSSSPDDSDSRAVASGASHHKVVIVGGGFGGLEATKALRGLPVDITLVDRNNYHLFQPLTYQVATGALSPDEIGKPLRTIFRQARNVRVLMAEVTSFDLERRIVFIRPVLARRAPEAIPYDTLVVAAGSQYTYFGNEQWRELTLEVKSLEQSLTARSRILAAFEAAELEADPEERASWLTFMVIGAGPTGVEMSGQIAELAKDTLPGDFRAVEPRVGRVLLVEESDRVLPSFPPSLSKRAADSLREIGVTPLTSRTVVSIEPDLVRIQTGDGGTQAIAARTVVWAAGVTASPLAGALAGASGTDVDRGGRVTVDPDLTLRDHPEVIAIGDMVCVRDATGSPQILPGLAPVAIQQGRYAGRLIRRRLEGSAMPPFRYLNKGSLATIGRSRAVADLPGRIRMSGLPAWLLWLVVHLAYLIGFENRMVVLMRWAYNFLTRGRSARWITDTSQLPTQEASRPLARMRSDE